jgi:hypothetical protein
VELGFGHDSNVNSATASSQIAVPALEGAQVTVGPRVPDNFISAAGGLNYVYEFSPAWAVVAGAAYRGQFNNKHNEFDTGILDGNLGLRWSRAKETVTFGYQGQDFQVDHTAFRRTNGVVAQWQHAYSEYDQASVFAQIASLAYPDQPTRDARRRIFGVAFGHGWNMPNKPVVFGSLYTGNEKAKDSADEDLGHKPVGLRFGGQMSMSPAATLWGLLSYERRVYGADDRFFLVTRRDKQADLRLGVDYTFRPGWLLVPQVSYTNNQSNIDLNKYNRSVVSVAVRKVF